ncbi:response regulator transcription factor [Candidatus Roizmanbacteria bacterium]|nr:response regulator transcription factor [Candidatus Roizmanbacteria bacterium]
MARILLVDDDLVNSQLYSNKLESEGHQVTLIPDGLEAQKQTGTKYDLIMLDVMIPGTDGISLLKEFKSGANKQTPVLMFTNLMNDETKKACEENGANALLYKVDTTPQALIQKIHEFIGEPGPKASRPASDDTPAGKTKKTEASVLEEASE